MLSLLNQKVFKMFTTFRRLALPHKMPQNEFYKKNLNFIFETTVEKKYFDDKNILLIDYLTRKIQTFLIM